MGMTLKEFSKRIGYSPSTISKVLNNKDNCYTSEAVKEKIRWKAQEWKYYPNTLSRALRGLKNKTIGLCGNFFNVPSWNKMFFGIHESLHTKGYNIVYGSYYQNVGQEKEVLRNLLAHGVEGIISQNTLSIEELSEILPTGFPFVPICSHIGYWEISPDRVMAGEKVAKLFIAQERRKIIFFTTNLVYNREKYEGLCNAAANGNAEVMLLCPGNSDNDIEECFSTLIEKIRSEGYNAIFGNNDFTAASAIKILQKNGIRIPEDTAVCGYDNLTFTELLTPTLTSVSFNMENFASVTVDMLFKKIKGETLPAVPMFVVPEIIERESTYTLKRGSL